ncbi:IclR family transcriptional regulator, partial [Acinetobacter baumannii]|nr:IclR family transcriptional regulator [Acinetobacter baumannii]
QSKIIETLKNEINSINQYIKSR